MKPALNWVDRTVSYFSPQAGVKRAQNRRVLAALTGYESSEETRKRRFHRNGQDGDSLARMASQPLRNQARHLERNLDVARGALDKLVDFTVGPNGITIEHQPKKKDGSIHEEFARVLAREYALWCQWPEVTWTHDWAASQRLLARTMFRDGEALGQIIAGPRTDAAYATHIPLALELMEPDLLPQDYDDAALNIRQGIQRNNWGRPTQYHVYKAHPGSEDIRLGFSTQTKSIPAERMVHLRMVDRIGQLRGVSLFASVIARLQDIHEYEGADLAAQKMAASLVMKINAHPESMLGPNATFDPTKPPVFAMDGGMIVAAGAPEQQLEFYDSKRPNPNVEGFTEMNLRRVAAGFGLSYSSVSRNYNGTYSAQRQELVENWPHYQALTAVMVAQCIRPVYQLFCDMVALKFGFPADLDVATLHDALYLGPCMPWIDPEREANGQLILVQAGFKSSAAVIRERNGSVRDTYQQLGTEKKLREKEGIVTSVDLQAAQVAQATPAAPEPVLATRAHNLKVVK